MFTGVDCNPKTSSIHSIFSPSVPTIVAMESSSLKIEKNLEQPAGIEPALKRWQRLGLPISEDCFGAERGSQTLTNSLEDCYAVATPVPQKIWSCYGDQPPLLSEGDFHARAYGTPQVDSASLRQDSTITYPVKLGVPRASRTLIFRVRAEESAIDLAAHGGRMTNRTPVRQDASVFKTDWEPFPRTFPNKFSSCNVNE